jgi:hypothetical protein
MNGCGGGISRTNHDAPIGAAHGAHRRPSSPHARTAEPMADSNQPGTHVTAAIRVVRAHGDDGVALARELAARHPGPGIDLRPQGEPILPAEIVTTARAIAAEDPARNLESRRRREDELIAALEEVREERQVARDGIGEQSSTHHQLLQAASWCEERADDAASRSKALATAELELEEAKAAFTEAEMRLEAVHEQQAAAEAVLEEAQRQLLELDVAGRTENEVRRELETANNEARSAEAEVEAARRRLDALQSELNATRAQLADVENQGADLRFLVDTEPGPIARAIDRVENAPLVDPDDATLTLADDLERRLVDLEAAGSPPPAPAPEEVTAAEAAVLRAREVLDQLRNPMPKSAPEWWDELSRLHSDVVDAEAAAGGRRGRAASQRRLEEALAAERALLDRLGFASHLDALLAGTRSTSSSIDPHAIPHAQDEVSRAEVHLHGLYDADALATTYKRVRSDIVRMRALGAALLGVLPGDVSPERLRQLRPDPTVANELAAVLGSVGAEPDGSSLVDRGRRWLAERDRAAHRLLSLEAEAGRLSDRVDALLPQLEMATSEVERTDGAARNARRRVEVLEAEMVNRMQPVSDPATRAATAAALRDHVGALEARITAAKSEAEGKHSVASKALSAATVRFDQARRDTDDLARRAALAARLLTDHTDRADDLLSDLGSLAAALRHEYQALDDTLGSLADGVAAAAEREAELSAAMSELRGLDADEREPVDQADALRRLLHHDERTSDVVLDPTVGFGPIGWQPILDALLDVANRRPIVVVDSVGDLAAWAERHESGLVEQVSSSEASSSSTTGR